MLGRVAHNRAKVDALGAAAERRRASTASPPRPQAGRGQKARPPDDTHDARCFVPPFQTGRRRMHMSRSSKFRRSSGCLGQRQLRGTRPPSRRCAHAFGCSSVSPGPRTARLAKARRATPKGQMRWQRGDLTGGGERSRFCGSAYGLACDKGRERAGRIWVARHRRRSAGHRDSERGRRRPRRRRGNSNRRGCDRPCSAHHQRTHGETARTMQYVRLGGSTAVERIRRVDACVLRPAGHRGRTMP